MLNAISNANLSAEKKRRIKTIVDMEIEPSLKQVVTLFNVAESVASVDLTEARELRGKIRFRKLMTLWNVRT